MEHLFYSILVIHQVGFGMEGLVDQYFVVYIIHQKIKKQHPHYYLLEHQNHQQKLQEEYDDLK